MSDFKATVSETSTGFHVEGHVKITYDFTFLDNVFNVENPQLADMYKKWGRCLAVTDINICALYGAQMEQYFQAHGIRLVICKAKIGEQEKNIETLKSIWNAFEDFGIIRKELVLVVGGGLITDAAG